MEGVGRGVIGVIIGNGNGNRNGTGGFMRDYLLVWLFGGFEAGVLGHWWCYYFAIFDF